MVPTTDYYVNTYLKGLARRVPQMISRQRLWNGSAKLANAIAADAKMRLPRLSVLRAHDAKMRLSRLIG